jgi:two-component system, sensor histidine kinase PdtaS
MRNEIVLVVEDESILAMELQTKLENWGYNVPAIVSSGEEVIKNAERINPDLVLMDIVLKGKVDGIDAAQQIIEKFDIPIIYLTAYGDDLTLQRAKMTEPYGYMLKPFDENELKFAVEMTLYRHEMDKKLKNSLKEKELLLKEIHHRVKNNMQIISSLLNLQSKYIKDKDDLEIFKESQNRVKSMAKIHEKLYQSESLAKINFADYVKSVEMDLFRSYGADPNRIKLETNFDDVQLNINTAIPCGLIINELITNSLKYAFPDARKGKININLLKDEDDNFNLTLSDDGIGFPESLDFRNTETLGLQLVNMLVRQLNGSIKLDRSQGTKFKIKFKELEYRS